MSFEFSGYQTRSERFQQELESPMEDVLGATAEQAITESPISSILRMNELSRAQDNPQRIDAVSARQRIKDAGLDGRLNVEDGGIAEEALGILMDRKKEEIRRQDILSRAPKGFGSSAKQLGMAFAASALDPLNIGLAFVPVVGQARYLRYLAGARGVLGRTAVRAGVGAAEGAAGAAIVEPLIYAAKTQEQADYDMQDSLLNVAFGTVFGGGLHVLGGIGSEVSRALRDAKAPKVADIPRMEPTVNFKDIPDSAAARVDAMPLPEREAAMRTAVAQAMQGKAVDVEAVIPKRQIDAPELSRLSDLLGSASVARDMMTSGNKPIVDRLQSNADAIRDLLKGQAGAPHLGGGVNVPSSVVPHVLLMTGNKEILGAIVRSLPVDVMNFLARKQVSPEHALSNEAMLKDVLSVDREASVPLPVDEARSARLLMQLVADTATEIAGLAGRSFDSRRAYSAESNDAILGGHGAYDATSARAAADRQASPASEITADVPASQAADRQLAEVKAAADPIAEQEALLADELAQLKEQAKIMEFDLTDELDEFDDAIKLADEYGKAARAAVLCGAAH